MNPFQTQIIKITYSPTGDTRRVQFTEAPSFEELVTRAASLFNAQSMDTHRLTYIDDEGDAITIANDDDVLLAFQTQQPEQFLRITVSPAPIRCGPLPQLDTREIWVPWGRRNPHRQPCPRQQNPCQCTQGEIPVNRPWWMSFGQQSDEDAPKVQVLPLNQEDHETTPRPVKGDHPRSWFPFAQKEETRGQYTPSPSQASPIVTPQPEPLQKEETKETFNENPQPKPNQAPPQPQPLPQATAHLPFGFGQNTDWTGMMQQFGPIFEHFKPLFQQFMHGSSGQGQSNPTQQFPRQ